MDDSNHQHHLAVNKLSKTIKKGHHADTDLQPQPPLRAATHPHVYMINKSEFRSFVQQITGPGPGHPRSRTATSNRLRQIRPPPLAPFPRLPPPSLVPALDSNSSAVPPPRFPAESTVSAYMRYLESSLLHSDGSPFGGGTTPGGQPQALREVGLMQLPSSVPSTASPSAVLQSPSSFLSLTSPNPRGLPSPGFRHPPLPLPLSPASSVSSALLFPQSPSYLFFSPKWSDM